MSDIVQKHIFQSDPVSDPDKIAYRGEWPRENRDKKLEAHQEPKGYPGSVLGAVEASYVVEGISIKLLFFPAHLDPYYMIVEFYPAIDKFRRC